MSLDNQTQPPFNPLPAAPTDFARRTAEIADETARKAAETARDVNSVAGDTASEVKHTIKNAVNGASNKAKELYHSAAVTAENTLANSKEYTRRNPVPAILGAIAFGAAISLLFGLARRKPTFDERIENEPLFAVRDAILGALAPMTQRVHAGYDSALVGAGKVKDQVHHLGSGHNGDSFSSKLGRVSSHLKFW